MTISNGQIGTFDLSAYQAVTASGNGTLSGTVTDDGSGGGVSGVSIELINSSGQEFDSVITDSNGNYEFFQLPAGQYTVEFAAPSGYVMDAGDSAIAQTITAGTQTLAASAYQPADISGVVLDDSVGQGVAGVTVSLMSGGTVIASATTASDGSYDIANVKPGSYTIGFSAPSGLSSPILPTTIGGQNSSYVYAESGIGTLTETLTVHSGDFDTISSSVYPTNLANPSDGTGSVTGVVWLDSSENGVIDAGDAGLSDVTVTLKDPSTGTTLGPVTTSADGSYLFTEVPQGTYTAVVTLPDGYTIETTSSGLLVEVSQSTATAENISAYQAGSISGVVTDDGSGNGIGGVEVVLLDQTTGGTSTHTTATDGGYSFDNLPAGSYKVEFDARGTTKLDGSGQQSWTSPTQSVASGSSLEVDAPAVCDLQLQTPQNLTVKVGQPVTLNSSATSDSSISSSGVEWQISYQDEGAVSVALTGLTPLILSGTTAPIHSPKP